MKRILVLTLALAGLAGPAFARQPAAPSSPALVEGQDLLEEQKFKEAIKAFKQAEKELGKPCVECQLGLAKAFNKLGAFRDALKSVEAVLAAPSNPAQQSWAYNEKGVALLASAGQDAEKLGASAEAFRKVLELTEGKANAARFNLGAVLLRRGDDAEGVKVLEEYLARDPQAASAAEAKSLIANPLRARKRLVPEFELVTLAGEYLTPEEVRGKVVLFDFWGTWCAPCVASVPSLRALARRLADEPFVLVSVSTDQDEQKLREFIAKNEMGWPQVWDKDHTITRDWQIRSYPTYLVVSPEGEIVYSAIGWGSGIEIELKQRISSAVRKTKKAAPPAVP